jgi:hypothetical protein
MQTDDQVRRWDELQQSLCEIMLGAPLDGFDSSYIRKYLIVYSDFRIEGKIEFWQNADGNWSHLTQLSSFDEIQEYLQSQYEDVE